MKRPDLEAPAQEERDESELLEHHNLIQELHEEEGQSRRLYHRLLRESLKTLSN